jgi:hypothetical protein
VLEAMLEQFPFQAPTLSDTQAAAAMHEAKRKLFANICRRRTA